MEKGRKVILYLSIPGNLTFIFFPHFLLLESCRRPSSEERRLYSKEENCDLKPCLQSPYPKALQGDFFSQFPGPQSGWKAIREHFTTWRGRGLFLKPRGEDEEIAGKKKKALPSESILLSLRAQHVSACLK